MNQSDARLGSHTILYTGVQKIFHFCGSATLSKRIDQHTFAFNPVILILIGKTKSIGLRVKINLTLTIIRINSITFEYFFYNNNICCFHDFQFPHVEYFYLGIRKRQFKILYFLYLPQRQTVPNQTSQKQSNNDER